MSTWSEKELQTLRLLWTTATKQELIAALPDRSMNAIEGRAGQLHLGRRDRSLGSTNGKSDVLGLADKIGVGSDPLLSQLRKYHNLSDVKVFAL